MRKLYSVSTSPPCRAVLLTAKALGISLDIQAVNIFKDEHLEPWFVKINPQHVVPTLDDDGFIIWDSHVIMTYLVDKYGKDDSLYPKNPKQRAIVDQRLHFDTGSVFPLLLKIALPLRLHGVKTVPKDVIDEVTETYKLLDTFLKGNEWVAGENVTIADFSLVSTVSTLDFLAPISSDDCPNITKWIKHCQGLQYYEENQKGLEDFKTVFGKFLSETE